MLNQLHLAMLGLYKGDAKRIQHFCKVHSYAKLIAECEKVDKECKNAVEKCDKAKQKCDQTA